MPMLKHLRSGKKDRKLHLFAAACCRRIWPLLPNEIARRVVEMAERRADGQAAGEEQAVEDEFSFAEWDRALGYNDSVYAYATEAVTQLGHGDGYQAASGAADQASAAAAAATPGWSAGKQAERVATWTEGRKGEHRAQCDLLRDIFGNPYRPVTIDRAWLAWNGGTVPKLAQAIYDERRFADLPILADALEEAGCDSADLLGHCRQPGEHVRGCWVLDRLLGKE
jgi:hypothetical protein